MDALRRLLELFSSLIFNLVIDEVLSPIPTEVKFVDA